MGMENIEFFWKAFHHKLFGFIKSNVESNRDSEDLLQEKFIKVHRHLREVKDVNKLESRLLKITRNAITDYDNAHKAHKPLSEDTEKNHQSLADYLVPFI